ncbi:MAG: hypothetical protein ABUL71_04100 [Gemmatimonadota bacterium]
MPVNPRAAATAGAATAAIFWILCSAAVAVGLASSPAAVFDNLFHLRMPMMAAGTSMPPGAMMGGGGMMSFSVTAGGFAIGLVTWSIIFGFIGWLFSTIYNSRTR